MLLKSNNLYILFLKIIYSCGCCLSNPGDGGWAIYLKHNNKDYKIYGYGGFTTTNEMELKSAIIASQCIDEGESSIVITDSQYIIKGIGLKTVIEKSIHLY